MHPEVDLSLLILLYAGKYSKIYNYSIQYIKKYRNIVTKLYIWDNQQETLLNINNMGSSETIRNNINIFNKKIISKHINNHKKPLNDKELGYYLAGLIDGDGHFNNQKGNLTICYDLKDKSAAYWLKNQLGYGSVLKIKNKNALKFVISHSDGLVKVLTLINAKLKLKSKYDQVIHNVLLNNTLVYQKYYLNNSEFIIGNLDDFNNYWLAGFIDADGSLQVKLLNRKSDKYEVRLKLQIAQKDELILKKIKTFLCGINNFNISKKSEKGVYIGKRNHTLINNELTYSYYLETTSFSLAKNVICYLEKYSLQSYKYINYIYLYKIYLLIQDKKHLTLEGINKIKVFKEKMKYKKD